MTKLKIGNINDVVNGEMIQSTINNKNYLIAKIDDEIYVTSDMCTHEDAELTMGCLSGKKVKCPLHGSYFDLITCEAQNEPAEEPITVYEIKIKNGQIFIDD